jgi:hypothetical protein
MNIRDINRYNRRIGDTRGRNPHNQPVYRWMHSTDLELRYPARDGIGSVEWLRQLDDDRWAIAMWYPPEPEGRWRQMFPNLAYPHQGMYYVTDVILAAGVEPNDTITEDVIGKLKKREGKTFRDDLNEIDGRRAIHERSVLARQSDIIDNAATAFGNIPGCRGGTVSFGGFEVPILKAEG